MSGQGKPRSPYKGQKGHGKNTNFKPKTLKGDCEELKDNVYYLGYGQAEKYEKTIEAILNYIQRTYINGKDLKNAIKKGKEYDFEAEKPELPNGKEKIEENTPDGLIFKMKVEKWMNREIQYNINKENAFALILGQCTDGVKNKLEKRLNWDDIQDDPIELLKTLKEIVQNYNDKSYFISTITLSFKNLFSIKQHDGETLINYTKRFKTLRNNLEVHYGKLNMEQTVSKRPGYDNAFAKTKESMKAEAYERLMAYQWMMGCIGEKAQEWKNELSNDYNKRSDKYPISIDEAFDMLTNYKYKIKGNSTKFQKKNNKNNIDTEPKEKESVAFTQKKKLVPGIDGKIRKGVTCYKCDEEGHYAPECPKDSETHEQGKPPSKTKVRWQAFIQGQTKLHGVALATFNKSMKTWLLLDNQSTDDIFCIADYLIDIHESNENLVMMTNGGSLSTNLKAIFPGYGEVWYHPEGITNILSLSKVMGKGYQVSFTSNNEERFIVTSKKVK